MTMMEVMHLISRNKLFSWKKWQQVIFLGSLFSWMLCWKSSVNSVIWKKQQKCAQFVKITYSFEKVLLVWKCSRINTAHYLQLILLNFLESQIPGSIRVGNWSISWKSQNAWYWAEGEKHEKQTFLCIYFCLLFSEKNPPKVTIQKVGFTGNLKLWKCFNS